MKAQEIIDNLLADPELYKKMAKKEMKVWGKILVNPDILQARKEDQQSAKELSINRDLLQIQETLEKHKISPKTGLSIACGEGRAERSLLKSGVCDKFHGIDISSDALAKAKKDAKEQNLNITYEQADLNFIKLKKKKYDLVLAQTCLHHVLKLEHVADQIHRSLKPGGVLWLTDYVGETQFQYSDERLKIVNDLFKLLPEDFHYSTVRRKNINRLVRPEPGKLVSPFESIRSGEIVPIFSERFNIIEKSEYNSLIRFLCPPGKRAHFTKNEESRSLFEVLKYMDRLLIEKEILKPCGGTYLMTPK